MTGVEDALSRVALFSGMSARDRKSLAAAMVERTFPAGSVITEAGKGGIGFFVVDEGTATVHVGGEDRRTLGPGDHFGEIALIDEGTRSARITTDSDLRCYGVTAWEFRPFVKEHPDLAWALLQVLVQRLREAESRD